MLKIASRKVAKFACAFSRDRVSLTTFSSRSFGGGPLFPKPLTRKYFHPSDPSTFNYGFAASDSGYRRPPTTNPDYYYDSDDDDNYALNTGISMGSDSDTDSESSSSDEASTKTDRISPASSLFGNGNGDL